MNHYEYKTNTGDLSIKQSLSTGRAFLWIHEGGHNAAIHVTRDDAPTVAAEILKAAGREDLAALIETEAAEKKLQERRNALAAELSGDDRLPYEQIRSSLRRAIDRIIELEDGQATR